ncbi:sporulation protein YqfD [Clostridium cylindrosporum]|uniref:Sporulation protein YqfD n=1 Tax=Clostridium cylindrosporum DSM 605 TaxID=1121307 RepID=A0A0J8D700_CLOCY|nr:sporulation protein YqfD [Clostridium cylindrosporum]KMT21652.1 sporulation protein YqfD [Clostridium cylindrosporum DSM 605]
MGNFKDFIRGEIKVKVESLEIERFINMATKGKIRMWNVCREDFTTISFTMFQDQYKLLKRIVRKTGSRTKVTKKNGMNFILNKINRRKFFIIGVNLFLILIFVFSSMILRIEIQGNKKVDNKVIIESLEKHGINYGKLKFGIKLRDIEAKVLKDLKEVSVVTIKFIGTKAIVNVVERTMPPEMDLIETPRDIISTKEGVISKITALKGQSVVTIGDYVKKGDTLISGIVRDAEGVPIRVAESTGEVIAKTWYEIEENVDLNHKEEKFTGRETKRTYFNLFNKTLAFKYKNKYPQYNKIQDTKNYEIMGYRLPIEKVSEIYKEKIITERKISEDEAIKILIEKIDSKAKKVIPKEGLIVDKQESKEISENGIKLKIIFIVEEKIGEGKDISPGVIKEEQEKEEAKKIQPE